MLLFERESETRLIAIFVCYCGELPAFAFWLAAWIEIGTRTGAGLLAVTLVARVCGSIGWRCSRQASIPPSRGRTRVKPFRCSRRASFALETSFGQEQ